MTFILEFHLPKKPTIHIAAEIVYINLCLFTLSALATSFEALLGIYHRQGFIAAFAGMKGAAIRAGVPDEQIEKIIDPDNWIESEG